MTTVKTCREFQAVNEPVSLKISVTPIELPEGENIKFQPTSQQGVSFADYNLTPTITVPFDKPLQLRSITIPRDNTPSANTEQFEVTFYAPDGHRINQNTIFSNINSNENHSKAAQVGLTQIPSNTSVSKFEITILRTSDGRSPRGVVLDVKACIADETGWRF